MINPALTLRPAPPLLLAAGLLFWGWQNDFLLYAIPMAILLESVQLVPRRLQISDREFNRIADISSLVFLLTIVYVFSEKAVHGIYTLLSLFPFLFYPLILSQVYSSTGRIRAAALFISLRKLRYIAGEEQAAYDLSLPYFLVCMISASAGNREPVLFFTGICFLVGWILWLLRPRRYPAGVWLFLLVLVFGTAYAGQAGIQNLQAMAESTFLEWFDRFMWRSRDPDRTTTAIGSIGKLKLSDRIMVRVKTEQPVNEPLLLREATYTNYSYGVWTNYDKSLLPIDPDLSGREWKINETGKPVESMTIGFHLDDKTAVIPVPQGITTLIAGGATQVEASPYGIVRMEKYEGWSRYTTRHVNGPVFDAAPDKSDLDLPDPYEKDLTMIARDLGLFNMEPAGVIRIVESWFAENFSYSLTQRHRYPRGRHLSKFLLEHRTGHCEFFATATALLLRAAGIPTRYVVGYSVQEYSPLEDQYIARASYAHSWTQAWVDGRWQVIDTTPAIWASLEEENRTLIEPLVDLWSWLTYRLSLRDIDEEDTGSRKIVYPVLIAVLIAVLLWRLLYQSGGNLNRRNKRVTDGTATRQGMDSALYPLLAKLEKRLSPRRTGETLYAWLERTGSHGEIEKIRPVLVLHYRYRFDPDGCNEHVRKSLRDEVNKILKST
ncbi:MAG TPA: transglutaminase-like domain-containing protein [Gammaproteobacteria bacterium]|nr:transglutaminase-like domain-containing protein [Gammaproteobacteria bacterium]